MSLINKIFTSAAVLVALSGTAQAELYKCALKDPGRHGVIPKEVIIDVRGPDEALVYERFSQRMKQMPNKADFLLNDAKLLRVRWVVEDYVFAAGQIGDMKFSLVFQKKKKKANLRLSIVGADNKDAGNGTCKIVS